MTAGTPGSTLSFLLTTRTPFTDFASPRIGRRDQTLMQTGQLWFSQRRRARKENIGESNIRKYIVEASILNNPRGGLNDSIKLQMYFTFARASRVDPGIISSLTTPAKSADAVLL